MDRPINETYIEVHSSDITLPCNIIVDQSEAFGLFTITLKKTAMRQVPFHFVFTIDTTLSMSESFDGCPSKMVYMQKTMICMLKYLLDVDPNVYITIHTFNTKVETIINDILLTKSSIDQLINKIEDLVPDNSTNIQIALENANKNIRNNIEKYPAHQHVHIFMTDGNANIGITSPKILVQQINVSIPNIFIGFGKDHNSEMLRKFSQCRNAEYYFVDNLENASLVYAESIHNILYGALQNVEFHIVNGQLYNYETNKWTSVLYENVLSSECHKFYQLKTKNKESVEIQVFGKNISSTDTEHEFTLIETVYVLPQLLDNETNAAIPTDLTKYAYRNKVQELMFLAKNVSPSDGNELFQDYYDPNDRPNIKKELQDLFKEIQLYMKENDLTDDGLLKMLCDDIYVTNKSLDSANSNMYVSARQTSQGRHRSYNIGKTIDYNDIVIRRARARSRDRNTDLDDYTISNNTTTCFASQTMVNTFNDVTLHSQYDE
jgi:hypothetical protein